MRKLTAELCRTFISAMKAQQNAGALCIASGFNLQAMEIALPVLEQQGGWISCSERMPVQYQSNRYVPLTLLLNERTVAQGGFDDGLFWVEGVVVNNVTRWQPLPAPPQPQTDTYRQIENDGREV